MFKGLLGIIFFSCLLHYQECWSQKKLPEIYDETLPSSLVKKVNHIVSSSSRPEDKFNKIVQWISTHKKYDVTGFQNFRMESFSVKKALKRKKLLSGEYSLLLTAMCKQAGIQCYNVNGYSKIFLYYPFKRFYYTDHSWNVVNLNSNYSILDITLASGYLIQRKTFTASMKNFLHIPNVSTKLKFKKKINPAFLNIPSEEAIDKRIPYAPMWQLTDSPYSMSYFEIGSKDSIYENKSAIDSYKNRITNYESMEPAEHLKILAEEGIKFNRMNNLNTGINYLGFSLIKYNELIIGEGDTLIDSKIKVKELSNSINKATTYIDKFLYDNKNNNKKCLDSLKRKSDEIHAFIEKNKKEAQSTISSLTRKEYNNENAILKNEGVIAKKEIERLSKINQKAIIKMGKSFSKISFKDSIGSWMAQFKINEESINYERASFPEIDSSIVLFERNRVMLWDSVLLMFNLKLTVIAKACDEDLKTNNIAILRAFHKNYTEYNTKQLVLEKKLLKEEILYKTKMLKRIDSLNRIITIKSNKSKQLLYKIKRYNPVDSTNQIDSLYERQNDYVGECYDRAIDNIYRWDFYLKLWNIEYKARKNISNYISRFSDKYDRAEELCYKKSSSTERLRYKKYNAYGVDIRNRCLELKENINLYTKSNSNKNKR